MAVQRKGLSTEEAYLVALIQDESGIDLAEMLWEDPMASNEEGIFRAWDFQYAWWRNTFAGGQPVKERPTHVIDASGRTIGKTQSIILRGWVFPIQHPGAEMVVTAPELVHLDPLVSRIEDRIKSHRLTWELLPKRAGKGFKHRPFQVNFTNGAKILGRIPQRDGKGVKGLHPLRLEQDESQDYPLAGWIELVETLRHGEDSAQWRAHGVSRGVRDEFYRHSQPNSGWTVHRVTGMHRPTWSDAERIQKIEQYGSRDSPDYKRNILGLHGDATNPLFVLHRLMATVDDEQGSDYNQDIYYHRRINDEMLDLQPPDMMFVPPGSHKEWRNVWAGMDVGLTNAPTEILIMGEESMKGKTDPRLRLLARLHLERISAPVQRRFIEIIFEHYDLKLLTMDRGGMGLPMYQELQAQAPHLIGRVKAYTADEKVLVGWSDHEDWEDPDDYEMRRQAKEYGYDLLRTYVDQQRLVLPWDMELLGEWQGQTWTREKSETNPYGKRKYSAGKFHTLDAAAMLVLGKELVTLDTVKQLRETHEDVPIVVV